MSDSSIIIQAYNMGYPIFEPSPYQKLAKLPINEPKAHSGRVPPRKEFGSGDCPASRFLETGQTLDTSTSPSDKFFSLKKSEIGSWKWMPTCFKKVIQYTELVQKQIWTKQLVPVPGNLT